MLRPSIEAAGLDPDDLPRARRDRHRQGHRHRRAREPSEALEGYLERGAFDVGRRRRRADRGAGDSNGRRIPRRGHNRTSHRSTARGGVAYLDNNKIIGRTRHEELSRHRLRPAAQRRQPADAGIDRHAGAGPRQGRRHLPQRSAHLGGRLRTRPRPQEAVAVRSRRRAAADDGARDRRRGRRRRAPTPRTPRSARSRWSIRGSAAANARSAAPATRTCA